MISEHTSAPSPSFGAAFLGAPNPRPVVCGVSCGSITEYKLRHLEGHTATGAHTLCVWNPRALLQCQPHACFLSDVSRQALLTFALQFCLTLLVLNGSFCSRRLTRTDASPFRCSLLLSAPGTVFSMFSCFSPSWVLTVLTRFCPAVCSVCIRFHRPGLFSEIPLCSLGGTVALRTAVQSLDSDSLGDLTLPLPSSVALMTTGS